MEQASRLPGDGQGREAGALLHVGVEQSIIVTGKGAALETFVLAGAGVGALTRNWGDGWPNAGQMEQAIADVEDSIMATTAVPAGGKDLLYQGDCTAQMRAMAGLPADALLVGALPRERIELWFGDLAAAIEGSLTARRGLPEGGVFAATLLVIRECMHHLDYGTLLVSSRG
ncbi:MAG: hypothetical protein ABN482_04590 [Corticimicrobacter sp.]|uniref:hypothetical protein n=1 Tax=Corticimicrobacter sp. TaxID=2678536 RepID=UPI0032DB7816